MKKGCMPLFVLSFLLLSASLGAVGYADVVAERPVYSEGDRWVFVDAGGKSTEWRFLREEEGKYVFSREGAEVVKDFNLMEVGKAGGFPGPMVKFPLKKGSWWKIDYTDTTLAEGAKERTARYEAMEYEKVTVAAGTFSALKITVTIEAVFRAKKGIRELGTATYWYAPDVKQVIKYEKGDRRWELKEYKIK